MYISFSSSIIKNPTLLQILYEAKCAKLFYQSVIAYLKACRCVTSREKKHLSIITAHKMAINMYNICIKHDTVHCYKDNTSWTIITNMVHPNKIHKINKKLQ